jgi:hypothetical protein
MKYVLLFVGTMEDQERFDKLPPEMLAEGMKAAERWFEDYSRAGKIVGGEQLKGPQTATTVRFSDGKHIVTDGPFIESKEVIGGFAVVNVKDLDEALEMAKAWPAGPVEVWPAVER